VISPYNAYFSLVLIFHLV